jgi:integrase
MGRRERIPTADEIATLLRPTKPEFRLIYTGLSQCGARPGELCRAQVSDVDWEKGRITLAEHKTARKTGRPRVIPIGENFGQTLQKAIDHRQTGPVFRSPTGAAWTVGISQARTGACGMQPASPATSCSTSPGTDSRRKRYAPAFH